MSQPCAMVSCKENSRVLCHCCDRNLCLDHLSSHTASMDFQSYSLPNQVDLLNEKMKRLDRMKLMEDARGKLDQWREENRKKIDRFYEQKSEEIERYYQRNIHQKQIEIEQLHKKFQVYPQYTNGNHTKELQTDLLETKKRIDVIEQKGIPINLYPLSIGNHFVTIGDPKTQEFELTMLSSPPYQTFQCSSKCGSSFACNDLYLLVDQNPMLSLYNSELTIIQQSSWKWSMIYDICWSPILSSFIVITEKNKAFRVDENNLSANPIEAMQNQLWISCTCSNSFLFLVSLSNGVVEYSLLPSITYNQRWDPPMTCQIDQSIKDISCNEVAVALLVSSSTNKMVHMILRSLATFDQLFTVPLDIRPSLYPLPTRCCPLKNNEWLICDANTSHLIQISKDGKIKGTLSYDYPPHNVVLFNTNKIVIRTDESIQFHQLFN